MICPLLSAGEYTRNVAKPTSSCDCLEEDCAWWINRIVVSEKELDKAGCAIKKIAERIL